MNVTVAEFKAGIDHYLKLAGEMEIVITKDGKYLARMSPASGSFAEYPTSLQGILPETATLEEAREERPAKHSPVINNKGAIIRSLVGILPSDVTKEEAREARLAKYENSL